MLARLMAAASASALLAAASADAQGADPDRPLYVDAEQVDEDRESGIVTATGSVALQSGDRLVQADEVVYDTTTGRVIARGNVRLFDGAAPAQTADEIELTDELGEGVAQGFAALLENNGRAGAAFALRRPDGRLELSRAFYTACDLCEDSTREPTWRLRASEVIRDETEQMIYYRDARLDVLGVPVFYSPVFAHADPSSPRRSGLLFPKFDVSNRTGFNYQQPYYWAISPYQDLTIAPRLMTEVNPLMELEYRRRFYSGEVRAAGSFTHERDFDRDGRFGDAAFRGHLFAEGRFRIAQGWDWGFGAERVTETLYLRKYGFPDRPDAEFALYESDRDLISQVWMRGVTDWYYADIAAIDFQSTRPGRLDSRLPQVAPLVRLTAQAPLPEWAGAVTANVTGTALTREQGTDYARASAELDWTRPFTVPGGVRVTPSAYGRYDAYDIEVANNQGVPQERFSLSRGAGAASLDISYPLVRPAQWGSVFIEPRVRGTVSSGLDDDLIVPNIDAEGFELSRSNLFSRNRAGGFDVWEDGVRVDAGVTMAAHTDSPWLPDVEVFNGLSRRLDGESVFGPGSGLSRDWSDLVSELTVDFGFLNAAAQTRYDTDTNTLGRIDVLAGFDLWRVSGAVDYRRIDFSAATGQPREDVGVSLAFDLTDRWSATYRAIRDVSGDITRSEVFGLAYRDECTDVRILYEEQNLELGNLGPTRTLRLQVVLFTLGGFDG
ncbi:LPS-assembly protein LptD [Glycocaulis profundi]|nr:LPS-assembly protein LptD [Glycocaulis profundi]